MDEQREEGRWGSPGRLLERLVPQDVWHSTNERIRARILAAMNLVFIGVCGVVAIVIESLLGLPGLSRDVSFTILGALCLGLVSSLLCLRLLSAYRLASNITLASAYCALLAGTVLQGGFASPSLAMYTLLPVVAGLVAGWTAAAGWAAAVVLAWVGLFSVERAGHAFAGVLPPESFQPSLLLNLIISGSIAAAVVVIYERMNETLRRTLARERAQFEYQARHDALTGIPNRRLFEELLDLALRRADRTKLKVALLILDLDDFKPINDRFGHATGDAVLCQVATRLRRFLRVTDTVSRLGGDEFAVVIELLSSREDAEGIAAKILDEISLPLRIQGRDLGVSASIGTALYPDDAEDVESLLAAADATMYSAKRRGGSRT